MQLVGMHSHGESGPHSVGSAMALVDHLLKACEHRAPIVHRPYVRSTGLRPAAGDPKAVQAVQVYGTRGFPSVATPAAPCALLGKEFAPTLLARRWARRTAGTTDLEWIVWTAPDRHFLTVADFGLGVAAFLEHGRAKESRLRFDFTWARGLEGFEALDDGLACVTTTMAVLRVRGGGTTV